jgi:serine phosphatase RsbU (regulator of sigma subunit)
MSAQASTRATATASSTAGESAASGRLLLRISNRSSHTSYVPLSGKRLVVGRADDADVPLDSGKVSRQHAEVVKDPFDRWWVRDLGSRNGTRVNGVRVSESILQPGDVLEIGEFVLSLCPAAPPIDAPTAPGPAPGHHRPPQRLAVREGMGSDHIQLLQEAAAPKIGAAHLSAVTEFGHRLNVTQDAGERRRALAELMLSDEFRGRSVVVLRVPRDAPERAEVLWGPVAAGQRSGEPVVQPPVSRGVLRVVCERGEPVLATNVSQAPASVELSIPAEVMAMTVIAAPLRADDAAIELLYVVLDPEYGHSDWLALAALAVKHYQQAEAVWLNVGKIKQYAAVERELEKAQEIQMRLIPRQVSIPGLALAVGFRPCYWVAGDYADVLTMADGRTLLAMADVCGKGLSAALVASSVHTLVHANVRAGKDLPSVMTELNQYLIQDLEGESFVTMLCIAIDPASGKFECINSGHPPPLLVGRDGAPPRELQATRNPALGLDPAPMEVQRGELATGELLVLFTDGVTELANPANEMLELEGLSRGLGEICPAHAGAALAGLAERLTTYLDDFQRGAMAVDDRTFLLARRE